MKFIFLLVIATSFMLLSCNNNAESSAATDKKDTTATAQPTESKQERNKKIIMASVEAMNAHNLDAAVKDAAPDAMDYGNTDVATKGLDSIKANIGAWMKAFPDMKVENPVYVADGDWVFVWATQTGTFKNKLLKMNPTNKSFKYPDVDIFKLNDAGKIIEHHSVAAFSTVLSQILPAKK